MFKRILISVLCAVLVLSTLAGCNLVTDNNKKNSMQVIATVAAVSESGEDKHVLNSDGYYEYYLADTFFAKEENQGTSYTATDVFYMKKTDDIVFVKNGTEYQDVYDITEADLKNKTTSWSFSSEAKSIYKYQLYSYINTYAQEYMSQNNMTMEEATEYFVEQLVMRELALIEAEKLIAKGEIVLDNAYHNAVAKAVYGSIDSEYTAILNRLRVAAGQEVNEEEVEGASEPTYPLYPYDDTETIGEEPLWDVKDSKYAAKYPGMTGNVQQKSMQIEAIKQLVLELEKTVEADFRMSKEERKAAETSIEEIKAVMNTQGAHLIYPMLGDTFAVEYLFGKQAAEQQKMTLLQSYIAKDVGVTDDDILAEYNRQLKTQIETYSADIASYNSASGEKLVLFHPGSDKHIYVKHILIQFSEEQKARLTAFQKVPTNTKEGYIAFRDQMAAEIVGYENVEGESDLNNPMTVSRISNIIRSQMAAVSGNARESERTFLKLIYKYNQDPGGFDNGLGYAVVNELGADEQDNWVEEFSEGARKLRNELDDFGNRKYQIGDLLDYNIVTDHGVHFMYYAYERPVGTISFNAINQYVTAGEFETYYDLLSASVSANKTSTAFEDWQNSTLYHYKEIENKIETYPKRYKDIYN